MTEFKDLAETFENLCCNFQSKTNTNTRSSNNRFNQNQKNVSLNIRHEKSAAVTAVNDSAKIENSITESVRRNPFKDLPLQDNGEDQRKTIQNQPRPQYQCFNCDKPGHTARFCRQPTKPWCRRCKKRGVTSENCSCPNEVPALEFCDRCRRRVKSASNCDCKNPFVSGTQAMACENENTHARVDSRPHIGIEIFGRSFRGLMDTGSTASYINEEVAEWLKAKNVNKILTNSRIKLADGSLKDFRILRSYISYIKYDSDTSFYINV